MPHIQIIKWVRQYCLKVEIDENGGLSVKNAVKTKCCDEKFHVWALSVMCKNGVLRVPLNEKIDEYKNKFSLELENDLNTSNALSILYEVLKDSSLNGNSKLYLINDFDSVLSLNLTKENPKKKVVVKEEVVKDESALYNCYKDEVCDKLKLIWEEMMQMEIAHLKFAAEMFEKYEQRDPEEIIGSELVLPCHFESQKEYVTNIIENEIDKRLCGNLFYKKVDELSNDWPSYKLQEMVNKDGAPSEKAVRLAKKSIGRDVACADKKLLDKQTELLDRSLEPNYQAPNTVKADKYEKFKKIPPLEFLNE